LVNISIPFDNCKHYEASARSVADRSLNGFHRFILDLYILQDSRSQLFKSVRCFYLSCSLVSVYIHHHQKKIDNLAGLEVNGTNYV